jgi:hypothetical protein
MIKPQFKISLPEEVQRDLHKIGERYSLSGNAIVAAAACELARVRPENLWHALGRISEGEGMSLMPPDASALPAARRQPRKALPV